MAKSNLEYWREREAERLKHCILEEAEYLKQIRSYYNYMMTQVQKEINGFYSRYAKKEGISITEARKRVSSLDIEAYEQKAKKYVAEKDFSKEANEEMRLYNATMKINRLELLKSEIGLELVDGFNYLQKFFEEKITKRSIDEFERQSGILGKTILRNAEMANAIVNASFHNATFSDRIWMYQGTLKSELSKLLQKGIIQGKNPKVLARDLMKMFDVSRKQAETLMHTELARVQTETQKMSYNEFGYEEYYFISEPTACPVCRKLDDGKPRKVKDMRIAYNAPPMHPCCRCSTAAAVDKSDILLE